VEYSPLYHRTSRQVKSTIERREGDTPVSVSESAPE
jgi:hypothetical protein